MISSSTIIKGVCSLCLENFPRQQITRNARLFNSSKRDFATQGIMESVGFIGGGNIARAIGKGILKNNLVKASNIHVSEPHKPMQRPWLDLGTNVTTDNGRVVESSKIIFLCVKTNSLDAAVNDIKNSLSGAVKEKLFVSTLAGVPLSVLKRVILPIVPCARIVRSTLNTPLLVGSGCTVFSRDYKVTEDDVALLTAIMSGIGTCYVVPEYQLDAVGGLVGCGPAYMYVMIEALADGAVKMGVPRDLAIEFAAQTMYGSAKMVLQTGKHPGELKDQVCSPGGITIHGLHALERSGVRAALMDAVEEATKRSEEIAAK